MLEARYAQSNRDIVEPRFARPQTENAKPSQAIDLKDGSGSIRLTSKGNNAEPEHVHPQVGMKLSIRPGLLNDKAEPISLASKIDSEDPSRAKDRRDSEDPM